MTRFSLALLTAALLSNAHAAPLTVTMKLFPAIVTLHLLGGMGLLALLRAQSARFALAAGDVRMSTVPRSTWLLLVVTFGLLWLQMALGAWVSTNYAVLACTEFPACQGSFWPDMDFRLGFTLWRELGAGKGGDYISFQALTAIHYVHRLAAYGVFAALLLLARDVEPGQMAQVLPVMQSLPSLQQQQAAQSNQIALWASEAVAERYQWQPGRQLQLPLFPGQQFYIAGVWRDYSRQFGALAMDERDYQALTGDTGRAEAAIDLQSGARVQETLEALRQALPAAFAGRAEFARPAEIRAVALRIFDRSFAATYALEAIAIVVGMAGVAATFSAQTLARTREFGMLRHIGVLRRQVLTMLALEGALLGGVGAVAGLALGAAMGQVLIQVVNPQSFHWTMDTRWPLSVFAALWLGLVLASALTAVLAGRSALSADAVRAVREDW